MGPWRPDQKKEKENRVDTGEYITILEDFYKLHKFVTLTAGVMFVNGTAFLFTSERKIKFLKVKHTPSQTVYQLSKSLNKVIKLFGQGGFVIRVILMDMESKNVVEKLGGGVELNIVAAREHMGEVYSKTRAVRE